MIKASYILESILQVFRLDERNMYDTESVDDWIEKRFVVLDDSVGRWLETRLRKYIINDFPGVATLGKNYVSKVYRHPDWVEQALERGEEIVYFDPGRREVFELEDKIHHVVDYFEYMLANSQTIDPRLRIRDLTSISVEDAIEKSKQWTKWLTKKDSQGDSEGAEEVLKVGSYTWYQLLSAEQLDYEGKQMGHCVGSYAERVKQKQCDIYSLRDSSDESHVTIEVRGTKVNQIKGKGNNPPIEKYQEPCVEFLNYGIDKGWFKTFEELQNINAIDYKGKIYTENNAPRTYQLSKGLLKAVSDENKNKVISLLQDGADVNMKLFRAGHYNQSSILMACVAWGDMDVLKHVLDLSPDLEEEDHNGSTALFYVNDADIAELLIKQGSNLKHKNRWGKTVVNNLCSFRMSFESDLDIIEVFLRHGVDIEAKDDEGCTALWNSIEQGNFEAAKFLLRKGADIETQNDRGKTYLQASPFLNTPLGSQLGRAEPALKFVIEHGADPNTKLTDYNTTILAARLHIGDPYTAELLLDHGANPNTPDGDGNTPLFLATSYCGHSPNSSLNVKDIVKKLLKKGADPNAEVRNWVTPLMYAALDLYPDVVELLLNYGANPSLKDYQGHNALWYAEKGGNREIISMLQDAMKR
jgi:ankyrin repeat protein